VPPLLVLIAAKQDAPTKEVRNSSVVRFVQISVDSWLEQKLIQ